MAFQRLHQKNRILIPTSMLPMNSSKAPLSLILPVMTGCIDTSIWRSLRICRSRITVNELSTKR